MKKYCLLTAILLFFFCLSFPSSSYAAPEHLSHTMKDFLHGQYKTLLAKYNWDNKIEIEEVKKIAKQRGIPLNDNMKSLFVQGNAIGNPGDILVTLDGKSSNSFLWAGGHAGTVSDVPGYVVESFGNKSRELNGVRHWINDWATRYKKVKGLWVKGAKPEHYRYVAKYNREQIGKRYNYNFFNIKTTARFYCSQLVWRAWYNLGWDLNDGLAVWPVDLIESPHTVVFYSQG